ncbi:phospholipase/lecithinase/hemolysin [Kushneria sinocarnis]|uniref:Phospholipase/lecithinase/hemolysin n=1 Tax=Kushneria sinocarnis TaxID=595502 RepID=A0A420X123_9GAMM|nr:SGNH/GDSL hydrolase family protein [Kushneria sinocarnis]RKR07375.1 phospholipase/lecithinase/hemolysin [Kushneria sinocarnis]
MGFGRVKGLRPRRWRQALAGLLLVGMALPAQAASLAAFGDSYSDNGRSHMLAERARRLGMPGVEPITPAAQGYYRHRWSNGPTAVEVLAARSGMQLKDMAVGGALTGASNYFPWFDSVTPSGLLAQVNDYLDRHAAPRNAFVFASANDFFFRVLDQQADPQRVAEAAAHNVRLAMERLIAGGTRRVMVVGAFDLTLLPRVRRDTAVPAANAYMQRFDDRLRESVARLDRRDGVRISYFDLRSALTDIRHQAVSLGFSDLVHPCLAGDDGTLCPNPDAHLLWDAYHPTRRVHQLLGRRMAEQARQALGWEAATEHVRSVE